MGQIGKKGRVEDLSATVLIITLSINGLNISIKGQTFPNWIEKQGPSSYMMPSRNPF